MLVTVSSYAGYHLTLGVHSFAPTPCLPPFLLSIPPPHKGSYLAIAPTFSLFPLSNSSHVDLMCSFADSLSLNQVFSCQAAVAAAEEHLQQLLPKLASTAGVTSLSYVTIQNQGSYLVELPATRTNVPPGWDKVCAAPCM